MFRQNEVFQGPVGEGTAMSRRSILERSLGVAFVGSMLGGLDLVADLSAAEPQSGNADKPTIRVVITGNNANGKSYVVSDRRYPTNAPRPNLYKTRPESPQGAGGPGDLQKTLETSPSTEPFRNMNPPMGGSDLVWTVMPAAGPDFKAVWHRTETVDYHFQITGELECILDEGKVTVGPGDVLIQRNTIHAWHPITATTFAVVLVPLPKPA